MFRCVFVRGDLAVVVVVARARGRGVTRGTGGGATAVVLTTMRDRADKRGA